MFDQLSPKSQEPANIFRMTQRKQWQIIESGTALCCSLPQHVLISWTAFFLFWGTVASLLIQLCNTAVCTCNVRVCYVLRESRASDQPHSSWCKAGHTGNNSFLLWPVDPLKPSSLCWLNAAKGVLHKKTTFQHLDTILGYLDPLISMSVHGGVQNFLPP